MARLSPGPATGWPSGEGSCRGRGAGHSYGTQGVWGFNTPEYPGGIRGRWNELTWQEAAALPGATHLGIGRQILTGLPWEERFVNPRVHTHVGPPSLRSLIPGAYGCRAEQRMGAPPT